jgi:hypothetical protein
MRIWDTVQLRADMNTAMNIRITYKMGDFLTSSATVIFSRVTLLYGVQELH